jgi:hypothetical protein
MSILANLKNKIEVMKRAAETTYQVKIASDELKGERLTICHACDNLFKPTGQCTKCWCFVAAKTKFSASECPINKW